MLFRSRTVEGEMKFCRARAGCVREGVRAGYVASERRTDLLAERADGAWRLAAGAEGEAFVVGVRVGEEVAVPRREACASPGGGVSRSAVEWKRQTGRTGWLPPACPWD